MDAINRWLAGEDPKPLTATLVADSVRAIQEHMLTEDTFVPGIREHIDISGRLPDAQLPQQPGGHRQGPTGEEGQYYLLIYQRLSCN